MSGADGGPGAAARAVAHGHVRPIRVLAFLVVTVMPVWFSSVYLRDEITVAWRLHRLPWPERQRDVYGESFSVVQELQSKLSSTASVDIIMSSPKSAELAVFTSSALAPRPCRIFLGEDGWRRRERATFVHDSRAVNAPPGPPPGPANVVLVAEERELRIRP